MTARLAALSAAVLVGCGIDPGGFKTEYGARYCALTLECVDPAELGFDGIVDAEDCLARVGPSIDGWGEGCKFKGRFARRCLRALDTASCPPEGEALDENLPLDCEQVFVCEGVPSSFQEHAEIHDTAD